MTKDINLKLLYFQTMTEEPVEIKRRTVKSSTGEEYNDEWFDIKRPLNDQEIEKLRQLVESLHGNFSIERKEEQCIKMNLPRIFFDRSKILNRIINYFIPQEEIGVYVIRAYSEEDDTYSKKQVLIREVPRKPDYLEKILRKFSRRPDFYHEKVHDFIVNLYLRANEV
ncbi:MAG: hypothetical protein QMD14_04450 [Candidatus Aenigmarchaeota archaeon]|nr:hypothetical protein [Candidatus Aenigmarchaeota archaeon]